MRLASSGDILKIFVGHIYMSVFGATETPVLDF